jgi:hypothetical protein
MGLPAVPARVTVGGYVWVLAYSPDAGDTPDVVLKLDTSGAFIAEFDVAGVDIALAPGGVWVADKLGSQVVPIRSSGSIGSEVGVPHPPDGIVANERFVIVFNTRLGTITGIDMNDGSVPPEVIGPFEIGHRPISIRPGDGNEAWTVNQDGTITRFDPTAGSPRTYELPAPVRAMTVDNEQGLIWGIAR